MSSATHDLVVDELPRRRRARRPRHPPPQGPRSARARVAAGPSRARVGVPSAAVARRRPEQPARRRCPRSSAASTRSTRSSASCSTTGSSRSWARAGRARPAWPSRSGAELVETFPRRRVVGRPGRGARTRRCSPSAISRAAAARRGSRRSPRRGRAAAGRPSGCCSSSTTASTSPTRAPRWRRRSCARCPEVAVLATSRAPLNVPGELSWRVPPLGLRSDAACVARGGARAATRSACSSIARPEPDATSASRTRTWPTSWASAPTWTASRWPSSWPRLAAGCCRRPSSSPGSPTRSGCSAAARGPSMSATRPSSARSSGATRCSPTRPASCSVAWVCSRRRSPSRPPRRWWRATGSSLTRWSASSSTSSTSRSCRWTTSARTRASACSRPFASSLAGRSTPRGRPRRPSTATPPTSEHARCGLWPLFHDGLRDAPRHGRRRVRGSGGDAHLPRAPRHARGARGGRHGLPARHRRAARRRGGRARRRGRRQGGADQRARRAPPPAARPGRPDDAGPRAARAGGRRGHRRSRARRPGDLLGGLGDRPDRRRAETRWRPTSVLAAALGDAGEDHFSRTHWAVGALAPRDGPPRGGHPALAAVRRGDGVHAVQRHGLVGGDAARPRAWRPRRRRRRPRAGPGVRPRGA